MPRITKENIYAEIQLTKHQEIHLSYIIKKKKTHTPRPDMESVMLGHASKPRLTI